MSENPCAAGLIRAFKPALRAAYNARSLGRRWDKLTPARRRAILEHIEEDVAQAHSLVNSVTAVARHRRES